VRRDQIRRRGYTSVKDRRSRSDLDDTGSKQGGLGKISKYSYELG